MSILKAAIPTLLLSVLTGCATTMTPVDQSTLARNYTLLNLCSERGLMNPNLAANGLAYYRSILSSSKYDADFLKEDLNYYYQIHAPYINPYDCNQFSVSLQADMIESQRAAQRASEALLGYSIAMGSINQSMQQSNENLRNIINENNNRMRQTTCYTNEVGTVRCFSF